MNLKFFCKTLSSKSSIIYVAFNLKLYQTSICLVPSERREQLRDKVHGWVILYILDWFFLTAFVTHKNAAIDIWYLQKFL